MPSIRSYDAVIIGTGQAGNPLARSLDPLGPEDGRGRARGESRRELHRAWVHSHQDHGRERVAYLARRAPDYGVSTGEVAVDLVKVRQRKRDIVDRFSGAARRGLEEKENVDLIFGEASFSAPHEVKVQARTGDELHLKAPLVFINTGTRTPIPDIPGLADVPYLTNATIMELGETPEHLVVLGGGYIGLEFAQMFRRFGARVTVVQSGSQVLPREDEDVATELARILREDGVDVLLSAEPVSAARDGERAVRVQVATPEGKRELLATALLVATGQAPNTDRLQLEAAGIERDREGFIRVNHRLETNVPGVYALGDVKGGPAFTHISYDDYRVVEANLLKGGNASIENRIVPYCVFTDPELGRVGLTEREARERGLPFRVARLPMTRVARALESDETRGFLKAIIDRETSQILGAAILGLAGGEVMSVIEVAMMGKLPYTALRDGIFAHPTLAESLNNLFWNLEDG